MLTYIIRRIILAIPILFGVALISFLLVYLAPGDPLGRFLTPNVRPEVLERLREIYGLDKPLFEQFVGWISHYVQVWDPLAWGISITHRRPVLELIMERAPATLLLMGTALFIGVYHLSDTYGQYGLLKKLASKNIPPFIKINTRKPFLSLHSKIPA